MRIFTKSSVIKDLESSGFSVISSKRFHAFHSPYWWLRCLFWKTQEKNFLVKAYKKFLEYQILNETTVLDFIEKIFNPLLGKSISLVLSKK